MNQRRLGARTLTSASLAASGVLAYLASWQRWSGVCPRGGFEEPVCLERQDHLYDYQWPSTPWSPIGEAAQLYGLSVLVLAVAVFALPFLLAPACPRRVKWPLAVIPAALHVGIGVLAVRSGMAGEPVTVPGFDLTAFWVLEVLWPIALILYASVAALLDSPPGRVVEATGERLSSIRPVSMVAISLLIAATTAFPTYFLVGPIAAGYVSHDTTPWSEAPAGVFLVLAAVLVWPATARVRARPSSAESRPEARVS